MKKEDSSCLEGLLLVVIIILIFALVITQFSCNTAKHMKKVYPYGYWAKWTWHSNHTVSSKEKVKQ